MFVQIFAGYTAAEAVPEGEQWPHVHSANGAGSALNILRKQWKNRQKESNKARNKKNN